MLELVCLNDKDMSHCCIQDWISIHAYNINANTRKFSLSLSISREIFKNGELPNKVSPGPTRRNQTG